MMSQDALQAVLVSLPAETQAVALLHYRDKLNYAEVAERLGIPQSVVKEKLAQTLLAVQTAQNQSESTQMTDTDSPVDAMTFAAECIAAARASEYRNPLEGALIALADKIDLQRAALEACVPVLERDIEACGDCDWGDGSTGKEKDGSPCEGCGDSIEALRLVREALA